MKNTKRNDLQKLTNFLFEVGILSKTPRSGFHFLGTGSQSVAEHLNRTVYIGYVLALLEGDVDLSKILLMCSFHDVHEARISDLNYVHQNYVEVDENKAIEDILSLLPGSNLKQVLDEYHERKSRESIIAKDADNIEWMLSLKEQVDTGNERAKEWVNSAFTRLKTESAKQIGQLILKTDSNDWWDNKTGPALKVDKMKNKKC